MRLTNYYDYSDPENQLNMFRTKELLEKEAMNDLNVAYRLLSIADNYQFRADFSKGFDENERLKRLDEINSAELMQKEINLFLKTKQLN